MSITSEGMHLLRVGDLARLSGKTVRAIHLYEEMGLLQPATRSSGGFRLYEPIAVDRLRWIDLLHGLGFSLHEMRDLLKSWWGAGLGPEAMARLRAIFLRKLDPFGFAAKSAKTLGYSMDEYLEFYVNAVDYIIELNRQGVQVMERHAAIMLNKILADEEPNYLDLRIPGGACIGQLGYAPDGSIYSSDEGRFVASMGDEMFKIGTVYDGYHELMGNAATRALVMAGLNDGHPDCVSCVYKPWCGQQVEYNYKTQGSLHGHMRDSMWCKKHKSIFDYLMHKLEAADERDMEMFRLWTTNRTLDHFIIE